MRIPSWTNQDFMECQPRVLLPLLIWSVSPFAFARFRCFFTSVLADCCWDVMILVLEFLSTVWPLFIFFFVEYICIKLILPKKVHQHFDDRQFCHACYKVIPCAETDMDEGNHGQTLINFKDFMIPVNPLRFWSLYTWQRKYRVRLKIEDPDKNWSNCFTLVGKAMVFKAPSPRPCKTSQHRFLVFSMVEVCSYSLETFTLWSFLQHLGPFLWSRGR